MTDTTHGETSLPTLRVTYLLENGYRPLAVLLDSAQDCLPGYLMTYSPADGHNEAHTDYLAHLPRATAISYRSVHNHLCARYADPTLGGAFHLKIVPAGSAPWYLRDKKRHPEG